MSNVFLSNNYVRERNKFIAKEKLISLRKREKERERERKGQQKIRVWVGRRAGLQRSERGTLLSSAELLTSISYKREREMCGERHIGSTNRQQKIDKNWHFNSFERIKKILLPASINAPIFLLFIATSFLYFLREECATI